MHGALIYGLGDGCAALLSGQFQLSRLLGMMLLGGTLYALEIPWYFAWLEHRFNKPGSAHAVSRALLAQAFFNPLWIARHIAFISCFSGQFAAIGWSLLGVGMDSFMYAAPFALPANYAIQNFVPYRWRFAASATFSAAMAVYYGLSEALFG